MKNKILKINYLDIFQRHILDANQHPEIDTDHNGQVSVKEAETFIRHNAHQLPKKMALDLFQARSAKRFKTEKLSPAEIKKWNEKLESEKVDDKRISIHDPNSPIQKYIEDPAVDLKFIDGEEDLAEIFSTLVHELFHQAFLGKEIATAKNGQEHFLAEVSAEILAQETLLELADIDPSFQIHPTEQSQHPGDLFNVTSVMSVMENISSGYAIYLLNDEIQEFVARVGMEKIITVMMTGDTAELNQSLKEHYGLTIEELLPNDERYTRKGFAKQLLLSRDFSEKIWKSQKTASN